ncbi:zinc finger protein 318-like [Prinia subflava]|uniref:zinc finger protein 318-like n=1 Tax=Prinia subflava TaxID=208062 RepID=UPI002FE3A803
MRGGGNYAGGPPRQRVKLPPSGWGAPDPAAVSGLGTAPRRCPAGLDQSLRRGGASPLRQLRRGLARLLRTIWFWQQARHRLAACHSARSALPVPAPEEAPGAGAPVRCRARRAAHNKPGRDEGGAGPRARRCGSSGLVPGRQRAALGPGAGGRESAGLCCCGRPVPARAPLGHRRARQCPGPAAPSRAGRDRSGSRFTPGKIKAGEIFPSSFGKAGGKLQTKGGSRYSPSRACSGESHWQAGVSPGPCPEPPSSGEPGPSDGRCPGLVQAAASSGVQARPRCPPALQHPRGPEPVLALFALCDTVQPPGHTRDRERDPMGSEQRETRASQRGIQTFLDLRAWPLQRCVAQSPFISTLLFALPGARRRHLEPDTGGTTSAKYPP